MTSACTLPNLNTVRYSSPVPIIGLYIAAGSLVCFLLMLFDIISAHRRRQSWIPCRFFRLNSLTLTMLAIASKLQVDLTTPMPGVPDQLLKLTGTTLLCICMGFLNLSVGNNGDSEYLSNMTALSIMIITVVVNICIQLSTGVIHLFIPENVIMVCCMLVVLLLMWFCARETKLRNVSDKEEVTQTLRVDLPTLRKISLLGRLKACYASGFDKKPQLRACRGVGNLILVPFCLVCCCVLVEAIVRSVVLKQLRLCRGASDYNWSTWFILVTQILTVLLGCFAICFRWFTSFSFMYPNSDLSEYVEDDESMKKKFIAILGSPSYFKLGISLQTSVYYVANILVFLVMFPLSKLFIFFGGIIHFKEEASSTVVEVFINQINGRRNVNYFYDLCPCSCTMEKVMSDFHKCMEESRRGSRKELVELISRIHPSQQLQNFSPTDDMTSVLPLAALVKTAITCLPEAETETLLLCFHEVVDIIHTVSDRSSDPRYEMFMRNPLFVDTEFDKCHRHAIDEANNFFVNQRNYEHLHLPSLPSDDPNIILRNKYYISKMSYGHNYTEVIEEILIQSAGGELEVLCGVIEQLFVDMVHSSFAELPNVIFKLATECPMDEYKDRVRPLLTALFKIAPLEDYVKWSFPEKHGISSLISPPSQWDQNSQTEQDSDSKTSSCPREDNVGDVNISSNSNHHHVTMEIEEL